MGKYYNYSLEVKNIGEVSATGWNVSLAIPPDCDIIQVYNTSNNEKGNWSATTRKINWPVPLLTVYNYMRVHSKFIFLFLQNIRILRLIKHLWYVISKIIFHKNAIEPFFIVA